MNFLAHAYLSFNHPQLLVGNMISDFVKGSSRYSYPPQVQAGIELHRRIDAYTDSHAATKEAKEVFRKAYRLYSGPITDILYDYFLANDTGVFTDNSLLQFTYDTYQILEQNDTILPLHFTTILPYMKSQNWLYHYKTRDGIAKSLQGLVRRSRFLSDHHMAMQLFEENNALLQQYYDDFFKDVKMMAKKEIEQLLL